MRLEAHIGQFAYRRRTGWLSQKVLARSFTSDAAQRCAVIYELNGISFAQVYPFIHYADELERRYGIQLRFFTVDQLETLDFAAFDKVLLQLWFRREPALYETVFEKAARSGAEITAFLDSFAHNDLRLAQLLDGQIRFYLKKSLYKDAGLYTRATRGHTNLDDYYHRLYGIEDAEFQWDIPAGFLDKLRLSPNFFTAPHLCKLFFERDIDALLARPRPIDVHARLGAKGSPWYTAMRQHALKAVISLQDMTVIHDGKVSKRRFDAEVMESRICFSPFGYGELCWRDIEAIAAGAVLLKPSMDHLKTLPDLYEPDVTYVPVAWDFSDVAEKVAWITDNPGRAAEIARTAFKRVRRYLETGQFVPDMGYLFAE